MSDFPLDREHPPRRVLFQTRERSFVMRPWTLRDAPALLSAIEQSRSELVAFMPWAHAALTLEAEFQILRNFIADYWAGRQYVFGVFDQRDNLLGGIGLHPRTALNPKALEVGYWCHSAHAGKGWTTLAVRAAIALSFDWFACDRLQVMHDETNLASRRVIEKCGFEYEGTLTNALSPVPAEVRAAGYRGTDRQRLYAIVPAQLPALEWLQSVREALVLEDAMGDAHRHRSG